MTGRVYSGINNIYQVRLDDGRDLECRIKGKVLKSELPSYNPLAPGDMVDLEESDGGRGLILARHPRSNQFARWNRKRDSWQVVAANLDLLLAVASCRKPPFRPRFIDRVLIAAAQGQVPAAVLVNKIDQGRDAWVLDRIEAWESIGIDVLEISAEHGTGLEELRNRMASRTVALFGPSGVGKSTLLNRMIPGLNQATGDISRKFDRGRHVTNYGRMVDTPWAGRVVDTPGVREILVRGIAPEDLPSWFPEFDAPSRSCSFQPCSHRHEPQCAVRRAVKERVIHPDRYENYLRIREELESLLP